MTTGDPLCGEERSKVITKPSPNGGLALFFLVRGLPEDVDLFRLPHHVDLRPSTLPSSDTPIRVSHEVRTPSAC
jgi:hypothetical protein